MIQPVTMVAKGGGGRHHLAAMATGANFN